MQNSQQSEKDILRKIMNFYFQLILPAGFTPRVEAPPVMPVETDD
jgi:hypothetical protein